MTQAPPDWQAQSLEALKRLKVRDVPALELIYLDGLAAHLLGPEAPEPPYTIEHGSAIASMLLRAVAAAPTRDIGPPAEDEVASAKPAREAVAAGAHKLATRGGVGVHQLVSRFLGAVVGELEQLKETPELQVRSLFFYGLMAIASGPENQANDEIAQGVMGAFTHWDERIGQGFVPPWREAVSKGD